MQKITSLKWQVLSASIFVFFLAQGFSTMLGVLSYQQGLTKAVLSSNLSIASSFQHKLERALRFGKDINNFYGMDRLLQETRQSNTNFKRLDVYSPDGTTLYSTSKIMGSGQASSLFKPGLLENLEKQLAVKTEEGHTLLYPVKNRRGNIAAIASVLLDNEVISRESQDVAGNALATMVTIICGAIFIIIIAINTVIKIDPHKQFPKKQLFLLLFSIMILSQLIFAGLAGNALRGKYMEIVHLEASAITDQLKVDIEKTLRKGKTLQELSTTGLMLDDVLQSAELIETITITDSHGSTLLSLRKERGNTRPSPLVSFIGWLESFSTSLKYQQILPLTGGKSKDQKTVGHIQITLSNEYIQTKLKDFVLDSFTVLIVALLLVTEIMLFLQAFFLFHDRIAEEKSMFREGQAFVRTATSIFVFGFMMSVSFVPLYIKDLPGIERLWGFSPEFILSIPLSVEMLCALTSVLLSGYWLDRRGWHEPFIIGIIICSGGTLISGLSTTPMIYIISRGLAGLGYGFTWMSAQGYILCNPNAKDRATALSSLIAGIFIGFICGNAVGAMLADRIGFAPVFQLSALFLILPLFFLAAFMRKHIAKHLVVIKEESVDLQVLVSFLKDHKVLATLFFSVIPISLCQLGLVQFIAPVYLFSIGVSQADIGRAIMLYGLMLVYIAPLLSRYLDRYEKHRLFNILGGFVGGVGLIQVYFTTGYTAIIIAIVMMGLASCFMISAQSVIILGHAQTNKVSPGVAISIQRTVRKLGHMLGPLLFGTLLVTFQIEKGLMIMGVYFVVATLIFILFNLGKTRQVA